MSEAGVERRLTTILASDVVATPWPVTLKAIDGGLFELPVAA